MFIEMNGENNSRDVEVRRKSVPLDITICQIKFSVLDAASQEFLLTSGFSNLTQINMLGDYCLIVKYIHEPE